ncbi:MAG: immune inhibitor A [candidate division Zixibacteria bacterium]|nr:immune inhibitor A [candidate division Zixibacteria bacterium]
MKSLIILIVLSLCFFSAFASGQASPIIQANVDFDSDSQLNQLLIRDLDITGRGSDYLEVFASAKQIEGLRSDGFTVKVIHDDVVAFYQSRLADKPMGAYKTLQEINNYIDTLIAQNPSIISDKISIGTSIEGRDIWAFKISDNPNLTESEPEILYTSCIHAREVITPEVLFHFIEYLVSNYGSDTGVTKIVDNNQLWFVLVVNPDGYYHNEVTNPDGIGMWRKNRRVNTDGSVGVDLNRNYDYFWSYDAYGSSNTPYSSTYRGTSPFSEPETQAMRDFSVAHDFAGAVYFHSKGNLFMYSWEYANAYTEDNALYEAFADTVNSLNGYTTGTTATTLYTVNGGAVDWHYGESVCKHKTITFINEVGTQSDGFWPPPERIPVLVAENLPTCLLIARNAEAFLKARGPETTVVSVPDTVDSEIYTVSWNPVDDPINPVTAYELIERSGHHVGADPVMDPLASFDDYKNQFFTINAANYSSPPYSFYSGAVNERYNFFQTLLPYVVLPGDTLTFNTYFDIESNFDYAYVEISTDGVVFVPIAGNITTDENPNGKNRGNGITGMSYLEEWTTASFDLSSYVGQTVYFKFSYYTDQAEVGQGIFIDDIYPVRLYDSTTLYYPLTETSMVFTDKPLGDYHYFVRAQDAEGEWGDFSAADSTVVMVIYICGDANDDADVNVGDAVFLINYAFKGGPAPDPLEAGDANCDDNTNLGDAVYIINYAFKGGPAPCCP